MQQQRFLDEILTALDEPSRLGDELDRRARALVEARDDAFQLIVEDGGGLAVCWEGPFGEAQDRHVLARLAPGRSLLEPALRTARPLDRLSAPTRAARCTSRPT